MVGKDPEKALQAVIVADRGHETAGSAVATDETVVRGDGDEPRPRAKVATKTEGRDPKTGAILPGYTGNMAGRTRGIRNKLTLDRLMLEDKLRTALERRSPKLLEKAIDMAMGHECEECRTPQYDEKGKPVTPSCGGRREGNDRIMRAFLDKLLSTPKHDDPGEAKDNEVKILIQNMTMGAPKTEPGVTTVRVTPSETTVERD